jgi:hypothetical protein
MIRLYAILIISMFCVLDNFAQKFCCGHELVIEWLSKSDPGYRAKERRFFEEMKSIGRNSRNDKTLTIPVVVHVVWRDQEENIPDSLIYSQIEVLNEDFSRTNPDTAITRDIFLDRVASPNIQFELVDIVRVQTNALFNVNLLTGELPDIVKQSSRGGSDAFDPETHLNFWVCKIQPISFLGFTIAQILGYAYPPAGLPNWPDGVSAPRQELDGVVVDYRTIGRFSPFTIDVGLPNGLVTQGRTPTHEIGHYLGLRHIWGDGGGLFGGDSCAEDDGVEDTPNQGAQSGFLCNYDQNTCIDEDDDLPDMIENFMDYASENCMNSFTQGQIDIMRGVLLSQRCALVGECEPSSTEDIIGIEISVYPNPASDYLIVNVRDDLYEHISILMYDQLGRLVINEKNYDTGILDVSNLKSGLYFMLIRRGSDEFAHKIQIVR